MRILRGLVESGATVQVRKAAQSFEEGTPESETDAGLLGAAAQLDPKLVCPTHRWYPVAMAPPIAAAHLSLDPISLDGLVAEIEASWSGRAADFALVETAGGVRSPLADRGAASGDDCAALLSAVRVDEVLLIADAGLGTIHAVRASLDRLAAVGFPSDLVTVGLSRFDAANPVHASNLQWLQSRDGLRVLTAPEAVTSVLIAGAPIHCVQCGEVIGRRGGPAQGSTHRCRNLHDVQLDVGLEPARFCGRCGRRMRVVITPTRTDSVCVEHGADFWGPLDQRLLEAD